MDDKFTGASPHRFKDNPLEKAFAEAWSEINARGAQGRELPTLIDQMLDPENIGYPDPPITDREPRRSRYSKVGMLARESCTFLFLLDGGGPISIGAKTQTLNAKSTVEEERLVAISLWSERGHHAENLRQRHPE